MHKILIAALAAVTLSGCLSQLTGDTYSRQDARVAQRVAYGTVESLRLVKIEGSKTRIGPIIGALIGGRAFKNVGDGRGEEVMEVVGAAAGAAAGAVVEEGITRQNGVEITVLMRDGKEIAVVQAIDPDADFRVGDPVRVHFLRGFARIVPVT